MKEVTAYSCGVCESLWNSKDDADTCCEPVTEKVNVYQCEECGELYYDRNDAEECCK